MIEPLDTNSAESYNPSNIVEKLNELINAYNDHYHEALDTHYNTSFPKTDTDSKESST